MQKAKPPVADIADTQFEDESDEAELAEQLQPDAVAAVVTGTDWTTETIVSQLRRGNIHLSPRFQRRDAWKEDRKSRFIESLIVGLPIPQIVLAEAKEGRGQFIVLDGKQRLLTILQYWGHGEGEANAYALSGLTLRTDLKGVTYRELSKEQRYKNDYTALCNQPIRTVVIRNWKDSNFLHTVFLRLNTGSVNLSPQELRQALLPGDFTDYADDAAGQSGSLRKLLGTEGPDPRMRDIEILARFLSFRFFPSLYPGRMKEFLDDTFERFNAAWPKYRTSVAEAQREFEQGVDNLLRVFEGNVARKPGSPHFNRAIFDALIYYHSMPKIRAAIKGKGAQIRKAYKALFKPGAEFLKAIESDTAGAPNTATRLRVWGRVLSDLTGRPVAVPEVPLSRPPKKAGKKAAARSDK